MILTIDFGTTVTKVGIWGESGLAALARCELTSTHPQMGWTEQDPLRWWTTVVIACAEARAQAPAAFGAVDVVACSGARQTFVPVTAQGDPIGKGILWSDRRASAEARLLAERMGGDDINRARTGIPLDAGAVAAKLAWLSEHDPDRMAAADVILSPRDFIVLRLTDQVVTDATFASRSGLYDFDGNAVRELAGPALGKLPSVVSSDTVVGNLKSVPGAELGLRPGIPVVIGAGDRQCEVLGSGASEGCPMVSWGTTANVSVPVHERPVPSPAGAVVTRAADGGWLLEGGLSAAGSFLAWLGRLLGRSSDELATLAAASPPGANGVIAVPWLDGARAPWWRDDARAGFMGLGSAHGPGDLSRAVIEAVAWDVLRCMEVVTVGPAGRQLGRRGDARGGGHRFAPLGTGPDVDPGRAGDQTPFGRGGFCGRRPAGRPGLGDESHPRTARPGRGCDRRRIRSRSRSTGPCAQWSTTWPKRSSRPLSPCPRRPLGPFSPHRTGPERPHPP